MISTKQKMNYKIAAIFPIIILISGCVSLAGYKDDYWVFDRTTIESTILGNTIIKHDGMKFVFDEDFTFTRINPYSNDKVVFGHWSYCPQNLIIEGKKYVVEDLCFNQTRANFIRNGRRYYINTFVSEDWSFTISEGVSEEFAKDFFSYSTKQEREIYLDKNREPFGCTGVNVEREIAACYALMVGPKVCTQLVTENTLGLHTDSLGKRVSTSAMCTAATKSAFAQQYLPSDLLWNLTDEYLETKCPEAEGWKAILFCGGSLFSWELKIGEANQCAQKIRDDCL